MMTMQPSLTILKIETFLACKQDLQLKGYREKSCASSTGEQGARKNRESSSFPTRLCRSLTSSLATQKWRGCSQSIHCFNIRRVRYSLSQFVLGIPRKNSSYTSQQRPPWGQKKVAIVERWPL